MQHIGEDAATFSAEEGNGEVLPSSLVVGVVPGLGMMVAFFFLFLRPPNDDVLLAQSLVVSVVVLSVAVAPSPMPCVAMAAEIRSMPRIAA